MECPFEHVSGRLGDGSTFARRDGHPGGELDDLGHHPALAGGDIQRRHPVGRMFSARRVIFRASDGDGTVLRLAEEMPQSDAIDSADAFKGLQGRDHAVRFELGEQRSGVAGLARKLSEGEVFRSAESTELEADTVRRERIYASGTWQGHYGNADRFWREKMCAGSR